MNIDTQEPSLDLMCRMCTIGTSIWEVRAKARTMTHEISREQMLWIVAAFEREALRWAKYTLTQEQHADLKFDLGLYDEPK